MAPRMHKWSPSAKLRPLYDASLDRKTDPAKIAYDLSREACQVLVFASKFKRTPSAVANGYVARHLVDKGCLTREPGKKTSYRITLRGEAVVECLRGRKMMADLFKEKPSAEA